MAKDSSAPRAIQLLLEALELPPDERGAFLDRACGQDLCLREELDRLLAGEKQADEVFGAPSTMDVPSAEGPSPSGEPGARAAGKAGSTPGRIGPYRLFEVIGEGGMGVVYRAEQEEPIRRRVAVKVIKLGMDTKEVVTRFEAERQALALMSHPSIAQVYDAGTTDGRTSSWSTSRARRSPRTATGRGSPRASASSSSPKSARACSTRTRRPSSTATSSSRTCW
jgi:hypothetical protein